MLIYKRIRFSEIERFLCYYNTNFRSFLWQLYDFTILKYYKN